MNLIEQQSLLRGMPDDALKQAIQTQAGSIPPYLVLTEVQRRKTARDRFSAMDANQKAANTVAEELMGGSLPPQSAMPMPSGIEGALAAPMAPGAPSGLEAAMAGPQQTSFATGGMVGYAPGGSVTLQDILAKLSGYGSDQEQAKQDAITAALLQASAAMLGNGSSNTFKNIGAGLAAGAPAYQNAMKDARSTDLALLQAQAGVLGDISSEGRSAQELQLRQEQALKDDEYRKLALEAQGKPQAALLYEYAQNLPADQRDRFMYADDVARAQNVYDDTYNSVVRTIPDFATAEQRASMLAEADAIATDKVKRLFAPEILDQLPGFSGATAAPTGAPGSATNPVILPN